MTLLGPDNGQRKTAHTDRRGRYAFTNLEPGRYELIGAAKGFIDRSIEFDLKATRHMLVSGPGVNSIDQKTLRAISCSVLETRKDSGPEYRSTDAMCAPRHE